MRTINTEAEATCLACEGKPRGNLNGKVNIYKDDDPDFEKPQIMAEGPLIRACASHHKWERTISYRGTYPDHHEYTLSSPDGIRWASFNVSSDAVEAKLRNVDPELIRQLKEGGRTSVETKE